MPGVPLPPPQRSLGRWHSSFVALFVTRQLSQSPLTVSKFLSHRGVSKSPPKNKDAGLHAGQGSEPPQSQAHSPAPPSLGSEASPSASSVSVATSEVSKSSNKNISGSPVVSALLSQDPLTPPPLVAIEDTWWGRHAPFTAFFSVEFSQFSTDSTKFPSYTPSTVGDRNLHRGLYLLSSSTLWRLDNGEWVAVRRFDDNDKVHAPHPLDGPLYFEIAGSRMKS